MINEREPIILDFKTIESDIDLRLTIDEDILNAVEACQIECAIRVNEIYGNGKKIKVFGVTFNDPKTYEQVAFGICNSFFIKDKIS